MLAIVCTIAILFSAWWPATVRAEDPVIKAVQQNLAVAYQAPQSSAEALLSLPNVYVLPGSFLYWFKHLVEDVRLMLAADEQERSQLMLEFSQERLAEGYQAIKDSNWPAAKEAFASYQSTQEELAKSVSVLQQSDGNVDDLLDQLSRQLGVQQALEKLVGTNPAPEAKEIGAILRIRPSQTLALARSEEGALLGANDQKLATQSAQASQSATPSATPSKP